jgi:hypothetical protein
MWRRRDESTVIPQRKSGIRKRPTDNEIDKWRHLIESLLFKNQLVQAYRAAKRQSFKGMVYRAAAVIISKALVHIQRLLYIFKVSCTYVQIIVFGTHQKELGAWFS